MASSQEDPTFQVIVLIPTASAAQQDEVIELAAAEMEKWGVSLPGFVSATFLKSEDGGRVVNHATWQRRDDWEAFTRDPRGLSLQQRMAALGLDWQKGDARGYRVARTVTSSEQSET